MSTNLTSLHNPEHLIHPQYRPDIDGLRAIAILSVVGFHAFPNWVKGGFIGVDVFFVISGFLISIIMIGSLERNSFSFFEFYIRRINRIFPALLLVLIASFAFGWFVLLADEYKQLGKHIAGGSGFISNFILWNESGYFDNIAEKKPLLHLWSLAVEEQFYIVWPLLLWFAWKQRLNLLTIVIVVGMVSFALNIGKVRGDAVAAFYSPQTRFWELMAGSFLAYMTRHKQNVLPKFKHWLDMWLCKIVYARAPEANGKTLHNFYSVVGALLIVVGAIVITKERHFPGWWALLPTLGAMLIISAGPHGWLNRRVLSNRVLVWFGLISFPLYLWHWPLLSFARIIVGEMPDRSIRIATVLVSIVLAWLTYKLIEKPVRFGKHRKAKTITFLTLMIAVGYVGYNSYNRDGLGFRMSKVPLQKNEASIPECNDQPCIFGNSEAKKIIVIYGDSHAGHLTKALNETVGKQYKILSFVSGSCFLGENIYRIGQQNTICESMKESIISLRKEKIYAVIRAQRWHGYGIVEGNHNIEISVTDAASAFNLKPDRVIISGSTADVDLECEISHYYSFRPFQKNKCNSFEESKSISKAFISTTRNMLFPKNIHFVFPYERLCPKDVCKIIDGSVQYYSDISHLTKDGALLVMPDIIHALED